MTQLAGEVRDDLVVRERGPGHREHLAEVMKRVRRAEVLGLPLVVLEPLRCDYRWASERLHAFVIDGMRDNARAFAERGLSPQRVGAWVAIAAVVALPLTVLAGRLIDRIGRRLLIAVRDRGRLHEASRRNRRARHRRG